MARPRKIEASKKTHRLIVRLNSEERRLVEAAGKTLGLKSYAYARHKILGSRISKPLLSEINLGVYLELKKIGVNINQLARVGNSGRFPTVILLILSQLSNQLDLITRILLDDRDSKDR